MHKTIKMSVMTMASWFIIIKQKGYASDILKQKQRGCKGSVRAMQVIIASHSCEKALFSIVYLSGLIVWTYKLILLSDGFLQPGCLFSVSKWLRSRSDCMLFGII